jgi:hypothetical protein
LPKKVAARVSDLMVLHLFKLIPMSGGICNVPGKNSSQRIIKSQSFPAKNRMYQQKKFWRHPYAWPDCCQKDWVDKYLAQLTEQGCMVYE